MQSSSHRSKPTSILSKKIRNIYSRSVVPTNISPKSELSHRKRHTVRRKPQLSNSPGFFDKIKRLFTVRRRDAIINPEMSMIRNPLFKGGRRSRL